MQLQHVSWSLQNQKKKSKLSHFHFCEVISTFLFAKELAFFPFIHRRLPTILRLFYFDYWNLDKDYIVFIWAEIEMHYTNSPNESLENLFICEFETISKKR